MGLFEQIYNDITGIEVNTSSAIFRLLLSMALGSIVGYERKTKGQTAGIRTFALISMGATLAMLISIYVPQEYLGLKNGDPGRIAAQVLSGIGFLGAGAIIQMKGSVRGLTTAAGIWIVATIGLAVGVGLYTLSIVATALIMVVLVQVEKFEHRKNMGAQSRIIRMKIDGIIEDINPYKSELLKENVTLVNVYVEYDYAEKFTNLNLFVLSKDSTDFIALFKSLSSINSTRSITLANQGDI